MIINKVCKEKTIKNYLKTSKYTIPDLKNFLSKNNLRYPHNYRKADLEDLSYNFITKPKITRLKNNKLDSRITLKTYVRTSIPKKIKNYIFDRDFPKKRYGRCYCCNTKIENTNFHAGHIIAVANGGKNNIHNLRPICALCNSSMGTMNMDEFKEKYFTDLSLDSRSTEEINYEEILSKYNKKYLFKNLIK